MLNGDLGYKSINKKSKRHSIAMVLVIDYNKTAKGAITHGINRFGKVD
jgi:hypothetical protein